MVIRQLRARQGQMVYGELIDWFKAKAGCGLAGQAMTRDAVDTAASVLGRLQRQQRIKISQGVVYLLAGDSGRR